MKQVRAKNLRKNHQTDCGYFALKNELSYKHLVDRLARIASVLKMARSTLLPVHISHLWTFNYFFRLHVRGISFASPGHNNQWIRKTVTPYVILKLILKTFLQDAKRCIFILFMKFYALYVLYVSIYSVVYQDGLNWSLFYGLHHYWTCYMCNKCSLWYKLTKIISCHLTGNCKVNCQLSILQMFEILVW